jgi:hypothetical protein
MQPMTRTVIQVARIHRTMGMGSDQMLDTLLQIVLASSADPPELELLRAALGATRWLALAHARSLPGLLPRVPASVLEPV